MYYILSNIIGLTGVAMILIAYGLQQFRHVPSTDIRYLWLNLLGACCVLISLLTDWNLSAFIIEIAWIMITLFGFWRRKGR